MRVREHTTWILWPRTTIQNVYRAYEIDKNVKLLRSGKVFHRKVKGEKSEFERIEQRSSYNKIIISSLPCFSKCRFYLIFGKKIYLFFLYTEYKTKPILL